MIKQHARGWWLSLGRAATGGLFLLCATCCGFSTPHSLTADKLIPTRFNQLSTTSTRIPTSSSTTMGLGWGPSPRRGKQSSSFSSSCNSWMPRLPKSFFGWSSGSSSNSGSNSGNGGSSIGSSSAAAGDDSSRSKEEENLALGRIGRDKYKDGATAGLGAEAQRTRNPFKRLWQDYVWLLTMYPLVTKALTAGFIAFIGDLMAQHFEHNQLHAGAGFVYDRIRSMAVMIDGVFITGPGLHFLYGLLESHIPTSAGGFIPATLHVLLDTFLFDPMFVGSFFCTTAILEGKSMRREIVPQLEREYWPAVVASWGVSVLFWPLQWACFRYLPLQLRVMTVNVCDVAWTACLSYFAHTEDPGQLPKGGVKTSKPTKKNTQKKSKIAKKDSFRVAGGKNNASNSARRNSKVVPVTARLSSERRGSTRKSSRNGVPVLARG